MWRDCNWANRCRLRWTWPLHGSVLTRNERIKPNQFGDENEALSLLDLGSNVVHGGPPKLLEQLLCLNLLKKIAICDLRILLSQYLNTFVSMKQLVISGV